VPVVKLFLDRIERLVKRSFSRDELRELLFRLKAEAEFENGYIVVEINSDRPDLMISEGIARAIKGLLNIERGYPRYNYFNEDLVLRVEDVFSRPYIAMATIRNISSGEDFLIELIQFQEKLHSGIGRDRRKVAIGIHDLSKISSGECVYRYVSLDDKMIPLHLGTEMSIREVLLKTEQGIRYGSISLERDMHPAIICGEDIISLPPVVNSDLTRLEPRTKDLLIDVTGTDLDTVLSTLEILTTTIAENSSERKIGKILVEAAWGREYLPRAAIREEIFDIRYINEVIGENLSLDEIVDSLERARFDVEKISEELLKVLIPPYRIDILHKIDLVEDIVISYGLDKISAEHIEVTERGSLTKDTLLIRRIRDILTGLGFTEIMSFILSPEDLYDSVEYLNKVLVKNPVSKDFAVVRVSPILSIIYILSHMQNESKPVKIFEINDYVITDPMNYTGYRTKISVSIGVMNYEISFEDIHSVVYSLIKLLGFHPFTKKEILDPMWIIDAELLIPGRRGGLYINSINDKSMIGLLGEVKPDILEKLKIRYPIAVASIDLSKLSSFLESTS